MSTAWAIVPYKEKSVRVPGKNLVTFDQRPLVRVAWDIAKKAERAGVIDRTVVAVDYHHITSGAWDALGDALGFERGPYNDHSHTGLQRRKLQVPSDIPLWQALHQWAAGAPERDQPHPDLICLLLPTSPLRQLKHVVATYRALMETGAPCAMTVVDVTREVKGACTQIDPDGRIGRTDAAEWDGAFCRHDGTALWSRVDYLASEEFGRRGFYARLIAPVPIPKEESCDVDTPLDLEWAEFLAGRKGRT